MARMFPKAPREGAPDSEKRVFRVLAALDESWTVVHSTAWQAIRDGRQGDGEADFIVIHRDHGIGVLEVKGGAVAIDAPTGKWTTIDRKGNVHSIKDPFRQATASKHAVLDALKGLDPFLPGRVRLYHSVVFPDVVVTVPLGTHPREIVIDGHDLAEPTRSIMRVVDHWSVRNGSRLSAADVESIRSLLAPTLELRRALVADVDSATAKLIDLTARQIGILEAMRHNRRLVVLGGAGTGKSVLAAHRARTLSQTGRRVLVTCFNTPLASHLRTQLADVPSVHVATFHALCGRMARTTGRSLPASFDDHWWDSGPLRLFADARDTISLLQDVIVDEGQDFAPGWLDALQAITTPDASIVLFADVHQQLYERGFTIPREWPIVELQLNCRNTVPIARWVARIAGDPEPTEGADGRAPIIVPVSEASHLVTTAQDVVGRLLDEEGLKPHQIVVLVDSRPLAEKLRVRTVGEWSFCEPAGHGVAVETIHRFKGLEADVVVLLLSSPGATSRKGILDVTLYVGLSRARSLLLVIASSEVLGPLRLRVGGSF